MPSQCSRQTRWYCPGCAPCGTWPGWPPGVLHVVLPRLPDADHCAVGGGQGGDARLPIVFYLGMHDGGAPEEDDGFLEQLGLMFWYQDGVDTNLPSSRNCPAVNDRRPAI